MSKYQFVTPGLWGGITAEQAMTELQRIRQKRGELKPEYVVEESRDESAVLHNIFQWDDALAAQAWRKEQAKCLIRNIRVVIVTERREVAVRAIVNVVSSERNERTYIPYTEAIHDDAAKADLLEQAKNDMEAFVTKYQQLESLNGVKLAMLKALNGITD